METKALDQVLAQLHTAAALAAGGSLRPQVAERPAQADFGNVLKASLEKINGAQERAEQLARDFEVGAPNANLQDVMISIQKANISFQQAVQVRNRLVSAYHEIMNMQI